MNQKMDDQIEEFNKQLKEIQQNKQNFNPFKSINESAKTNKSLMETIKAETDKIKDILPDKI